MAVTDYYERKMFMATVNISSGVTLRYGPGSNYDTAEITATSEYGTIKWKEGQYYYVDLSSPKRCLYVEASSAHLIPGTGTVSSFTPRSLPRYVNYILSPYLGDTDEYNRMYPSSKATLDHIIRGQELLYLGKKSDDNSDVDLVYVEYTSKSTYTKRRAWYPSSNLLDPPSRLSKQGYINKIDNFSVENYPIDSEGSHCSNFAWDVMNACGTMLPEGSCRVMLQSLNTNSFARWRRINGSLDYKTAQSSANQGYPTIAIEESHVSVVRPNDGSSPASILDVAIAQAGSELLQNSTIRYGWSSSLIDSIEFYRWEYT